MATVSLTTEREVATISLSNAPANVLSIPLMADLAQHFRTLSAMDHKAGRPRVIFLKSQLEGQYSQGIDPQAILAADVAGRLNIFLALADLVESIWFCAIPVFTDINGPALAGGAVLASLADFAIVNRSAGKIAFSEAKVGLPLPLFVQEIIRSRTNPSCWNEVMLLGKNLDADEALRLGFAHAVYDGPDDRDVQVKAYLSKICRLPPAVLSETLRASRSRYRSLFPDFRKNLDAFKFFLSDDYLGEGVGAFLAGRPPKF